MSTSPHHAALLAFLRDAPPSPNLPDDLQPSKILDDRALLRLMFYTQRMAGGDPSTQRLTRIGLMILSEYARPYEVLIPEGETLTLAYLKYLKDHTTMPFFCSTNSGSTANSYIVFDAMLAVKLKLADGTISTLIEMES